MGSKRPVTPSSSISTASLSRPSRSPTPWSDLSYDLLVSIFSRLSSVDLIVGVSTVCSSWRAAARDPHCWKIVDLSDWCSVACRIAVPVRFSHVFKRALALVSDSERIEKVFVPSIANGQDLILVSQRLPNLLYLSFPNDCLNEKEICSAMTNFKSLKGIEADDNFFHVIIGSIPHLITVSEIKMLSGGERKFWRERKSWRDWFIDLLMRRAFPNLRNVEISELCFDAQKLLDVDKKVKYRDVWKLRSSRRQKVFSLEIRSSSLIYI